MQDADAVATRGVWKFAKRQGLKMGFEDLDKLSILMKEIDLIQDCIKRMASNSFFIKGWNITIVAACITMAEKQGAYSGYIAAIVSCLAFWWLDTYYLRLERMYQRKYKWVLENRMKTFDNVFDLNPANKAMWGELTLDAISGSTDRSVNFCAVQWSPTLRNFYIPFLVASGVLLVASTTPLIIKGVLAFLASFVIYYSYKHKKDWE